MLKLTFYLKYFIQTLWHIAMAVFMAIVMVAIMVAIMGLLAGVMKLFGELFGTPIWFQTIGSVIALLYGMLVLVITADAGPENTDA